MADNEQKQEIFRSLGYTPSVEQATVLYSDARYKLIAGGERSGKSYTSAIEYMGKFWETPLLWLVAADYERTGAEFSYIIDAFDKLNIQCDASKRLDPGEILVYSKGKQICRIVTKSAKDPRKLAVEAPDGIIGCEASQLDYDTFLRIRGRAAEKRAWVLLSGTFESSLGWYPEAFNRYSVANEDGWEAFSLPTWSNLAIFPGGRQDPEILELEKTYSTAWFMERFGGIPCPPRGRVFNEFNNLIHTGAGGDFEFDPALDCEIWVDPGYAGACAVEVAQRKGEHIFIVDEIYEKGLVTSEVITITMQKPWWGNVIGGAIDIAALQHQAMPAPAEIWIKEASLSLRSNKIRIQDGIERVKACLKVNPITNRPQLYVNSKCKGLLSEMGGAPNPFDGQTRVYRWQQDRDGNIVGDVPKDENNHACKALAYGLVDMLGYSETKRRGEIRFW